MERYSLYSREVKLLDVSRISCCGRRMVRYSFETSQSDWNYINADLVKAGILSPNVLKLCCANAE